MLPMARLRDVAPVFKRVGFVKYWKGVWQQCYEDGVFTWASALALPGSSLSFLSSSFSSALVPYLRRKGKFGWATTSAPISKKPCPPTLTKPSGMVIWNGAFPDLLNNRPKGFLSIGLILAIWGASGGVAMTLRGASINVTMLTAEHSFYRVRLKSMFLTIIEAIFMLAVAVLLPVATTLRVWVQKFVRHLQPADLIPDWGLWLFEITRLVLALICMFCAVGLIYSWPQR